MFQKRKEGRRKIELMNLQEEYRAIKLLEVSRRLYDIEFKPQFRKIAKELGTTHPNLMFI